MREFVLNASLKKIHLIKFYKYQEIEFIGLINQIELLIVPKINDINDETFI
jgi:hypothetical protein